MALLQNRRGLIVGVANERSIAYGIAKAARAHGAELALSYQTERLHKPVAALAESLGVETLLPCDLTEPAQVDAMRDALTRKFGHLDFVVHAVAAAKREELEGRFLDTTLNGFHLAMDVSVYTLLTLTRAVERLLLQGTSPNILTLSYLGSTRALPSYNVMGVAKAALEASVRYLARDLGPQGIRVNALSAGPIRTLSAAGIKGLRKMLSRVEADAPLRRNVTIDEVGDAALFALSDLGRGMTGETFFVDAGYHTVGAPGIEDGVDKA